MKYLLNILSFLLIPFFGWSQAQIVINNDAFINIENSASLVIDNSNANALITTGTGGNILSEAEADIIKWNINTSTGNYTIPFTTVSGVKIPLSVNITTAGVGAGSLDLSTYETIDHLNTPFASGVTNLNINGVANELHVVDRFWRIDTTDNYTINPTVSASFGYDPLEYAAPNTITEANLQAQRWNTTANSWEGLLFGTVNTANDSVNNVAITPTGFFPVWVLVDNTVPLPVTLSHFEAICSNDEKLIEWSTASEINNDYFVVEKSYDAISFFDLETVQGNGNSNTTNNYSVIDLDNSTATIYYRLKQVDFNGVATYHNITSVKCNSNSEFSVNNIVFVNGTLDFNINTTTNERVAIKFYDYKGRIISSQNETITLGDNPFRIQNRNLNSSIYLLSIVGEQNFYSVKLMNNRR
jgi:hypothetical protein